MTLALLIDSDGNSRLRLARLLEGAGLDVSEAGDGEQAIRLFFDERPDAAVVDLSAVGGGVALLGILRAACPVPIIALTDDGDSTEVVLALNAGADVVLPRTCGSHEFLARVRAAIRLRELRTDGPTRSVRTGGLVIDRDARTVTKHGRFITLTRTEYLMLDTLASCVGEVASHRSLLSAVWGEAFVNDVQYLRVYAGYLRQKLERDPSNPEYLLNEWGVGYRLAQLPIEVAKANDAACDREMARAS